MGELRLLKRDEAAEHYRRHEVKPVELVETYRERIERLDPQLNAYVTVCTDEALAAARVAEGVETEAPFHGVPISIKDLFFFSSRRRHTRCLSDWSSDVCSSD